MQQRDLALQQTPDLALQNSIHHSTVSSFVTPNNTITLTGTATSGLPITYASTTPTVCTVTASTATATIVTPGTCTLTADQAGNDTVNAAVQVTASITVNQATQTITGFNPPVTISQAAGSTLTLFATGGASGNPVLFASTTLSICTTAGTNGQTLTIAADGVCALTANQAGNTNYRAAAPQTASITINVPAQLYFIHADHLGTPRTITNAIDNTKVWEWKNDDAFGNNPPDENPANANAQPFKYHLRFPGQYFDQETGTYYNYFRDYEPSTGRYVQSDPIGLKGGINTYAYVGLSPLLYTDPTGLIYRCIAPLHALPGGFFDGKGPLHHAFVCDDAGGNCYGQDWKNEKWWHNPLLSPGRPSEGDKFNKDHCARIGPGDRCLDECVKKRSKSTERPLYSVVPGAGPYRMAPMCQEFADMEILTCILICAAKK